MSNRLFVMGFPKETSEKELQELFSKHGKVRY
jgi:RNA recognition motif-containing protein